MLISRLTQENKIKIIPVNKSEKNVQPMTSENAAAVGRKLGADHVVFGSVTIFGESVSTDARMVAVDSGRTELRFSRAGRSRSELIQHIDALAGQIQAELFGTPPPKTGALSQGAEKLSEVKIPVDETTSTAVEPAQRRISRKFNFEIRGVAVGDVDGDHRQEIVFMSQNNIFIYRPGPKGIAHVAEIKEKSYNNFLSLDVVDANKNGRAEIFISNLPFGHDRLDSFVLEYDGSDYRRIASNEHLFFRSLPLPDGGQRLIGQRHNFVINTSGDNQIFEGKVFGLIWENDGYEPDANLSLPRGATIFNFTRGELLTKGEDATLQYDGSNVLRAFDKKGEEVWSSAESFGSVATYLELPDSQKVKKSKDRFYLPTRLLPLDYNGDGKTDLLVIKNKESYSGLSRVKGFKSGQMVCLSWDGLNFAPIWQSKIVSKSISDFDVADLTGTGQREIIYAVVAKAKSTFNNGQSYIVRDPIPTTQK